MLDGQVISAPTFQGRIPDGSAQISGNFSETEAESLSTSLKFGALPISFQEPSIDTIGPSLAGDQLRAGLTAGAIGLALVMLYCLLYYRGLGLVVIASLGVAGAITYAMVLLLSETAGFTLTLPGVAGLIIAVGITADSFIILFERIRDEMRDGKSMRVAVESAWVRARNTDSGRRRGLADRRGGALHLRLRCREGLRVRARPDHAHRPRGLLLLHQADGVLPGALPVLQQGAPPLGAERSDARHRRGFAVPAGGKA